MAQSFEQAAVRHECWADQSRFESGAAFVPPIPVGGLPVAAHIFLGVAFLLAFYFSTLGASRFSAREPAVIIAGSLAAGFGVVALFAAIGVIVDEFDALPRVPPYGGSISPEARLLVKQRCAGGPALKESLTANSPELTRTITERWQTRATAQAPSEAFAVWSTALPESFRFDEYDQLSSYATSVPVGDTDATGVRRAEPSAKSGGPVLHISVYSRRHNTLTRHAMDTEAQPIDGEFVLTQRIEATVSNTLAEFVSEITCRNANLPERTGWRDDTQPEPVQLLWTGSEERLHETRPTYPAYTGAMLETDVCVMIGSKLYGRLPTNHEESYVRALLEHGRNVPSSPFSSVEEGGTLDVPFRQVAQQLQFGAHNWLLHVGDCEHRWTIDWVRDRAGDMAFPRTTHLKRWMQTSLARQYLAPKKLVLREKSRVSCDICAGLCDASVAVVGGDQVCTVRLQGLPQMVTPMCEACFRAAVGMDIKTALGQSFVSTSVPQIPTETYTLMTNAQRLAYERLVAAARACNTARVWDACGDVKKALSTQKAHSVNNALRNYAYHALLERFAADGAYTAAASVLGDMSRVGAAVDVHTYDLVLAAAAATGDLVHVEEALSNYPASTSAASDILAGSRTSAWTPATFEHLLCYCRTSHNFEFALAVMRALEERGSPPSGAAIQLFLECATGVGEARIAFEFAQQISNCDAVHWMTVLRGAAEQCYSPALQESWKRVAEAGCVPDEGLCTDILTAAARDGLADLAESVVHAISSQFGSDAVCEWHLTPLFAAQCTAHRFSGAVQTLVLMKERDISPRHAAAQLAAAASQSKSMLATAIDAVLASDAPIDAYNALIYASAEQKSLSDAQRVFSAALNAGADASTFSAMLHTCLELNNLAAAEAVWAQLTTPDAVSFEKMIRIYLQSDAYDAAFNLLEACKGHDMVPTRRTYAAMIWTCWRRQDSRTDALVQEMFEAGYEPSDSLKNALGLAEPEND
ncbi:hypothetical protein MCUN1_003334 [Malassezia cuniculi]|uniref:Pentatricopeptide repeat-containing protein-mitochondrial domain-containing protein n=1 Tax=Malassezia cuniculi TaxID=948313 RepID=A0AAF0EWS0_9BASI|nr:hypothetical protein MCUN1_003334 [Malassezia cuniculi]